MAAIFFDLQGTVLEFTRSYDDVLAESLEATLGHAGQDLLETYSAAFYDHFVNLEAHPYAAGMAAVRDAASNFDGDPPPVERMVADLCDREVDMCVIPDGIESLLAVLDARYRLGVLTNGVREWQLAKLDGHGLADTFDAVVASYEAGAHKPDRAAYDLARERLPADAYVMIGDDLETDVIGARQAGFGAIHLDRHADAPAALDDPATLREAFEQAN